MSNDLVQLARARNLADMSGMGGMDGQDIEALGTSGMGLEHSLLCQARRDAFRMICFLLDFMLAVGTKTVDHQMGRMSSRLNEMACNDTLASIEPTGVMQNPGAFTGDLIPVVQLRGRSARRRLVTWSHDVALEVHCAAIEKLRGDVAAF